MMKFLAKKPNIKFGFCVIYGVSFTVSNLDYISATIIVMSEYTV